MISIDRIPPLPPLAASAACQDIKGIAPEPLKNQWKNMVSHVSRRTSPLAHGVRISFDRISVHLSKKAQKRCKTKHFLDFYRPHSAIASTRGFHSIRNCTTARPTCRLSAIRPVTGKHWKTICFCDIFHAREPTADGTGDCERTLNVSNCADQRARICCRKVRPVYIF